MNEADWHRADTIRIERVKLRVTQFEVAAEVGIARSTLATYEAGVKPMNDGRYEAIMAALDKLCLVRPSYRRVRRRR